MTWPRWRRPVAHRQCGSRTIHPSAPRRHPKVSTSCLRLSQESRSPRAPQPRKRSPREPPRLTIHRVRMMPRTDPDREIRGGERVAVLGGAIAMLGLLLVPLPGPGWLIVFLGLAISSHGPSDLRHSRSGSWPVSGNGGKPAVLRSQQTLTDHVGRRVPACAGLCRICRGLLRNPGTESGGPPPYSQLKQPDPTVSVTIGSQSSSSTLSHSTLDSTISLPSRTPSSPPYVARLLQEPALWHPECWVFIVGGILGAFARASRE
ncbi:PGPGW domain-containing protein [Leifsonia sp. NPDC058248]|uniref:PGPGW domain-containing protein n=1 Tax=Leifsonia sp. NPDC058248 TaxID=3346402 RepID=UPI0036D90FD0